MQQDRLPDAVTAFERAAEAEPYQPAFWPPAIDAALQAGHLDQARALSRRASVLHPNNAELAHLAGRVRAAGESLEAGVSNAAASDG